MAVAALVSFRKVLFGVSIAALLAGMPQDNALAQTAPAMLKGAEERNYGRLLFTLPTAQKVTARVSNGVLVVNFSDPVNLAADRVTREMPAYLSVARVDPDGRGIRFALTRPYTVNVLEAGEKVFIDLIPENWSGMLPGLPPEIVEDLAKRVRTAEAVARTVQRSREQSEVREIEVRASVLPTLSRLVFDIPAFVNVDHKIDPGAIDITMHAPLRIEGSKLRSVLPDGVKLDRLEAVDGTLRFKLAIPERFAIKGFREEDGFIVDMVDTQRPAASPEAPPPPGSQAAAGTPPVSPAPAMAGAKPALKPAQPAAAPSAEAKAEPMPAAVAPVAPQPVQIKATAQDDGARIDFVFPRRTAAAAFQDRGDVVVVFDTIDAIEAADILAAAPTHVAAASASKEGKATVLRLQMKQPGLVRLGADGLRWSLTAGDKGVQAVEPLTVRRTADERGQTVLMLPLAQVSGVHWIASEGGFNHAVATAFGPASAVPKPQRFVEFLLEQTMQGVAVLALADDVTVRAGVGEVIISRGAGLAISTVQDKAAASAETAQVALVPDKAQWAEFRLGSARERLNDLTRRAAAAPRSERTAARMALATFQLANGLDAEALGPIANVLREDPNMRNDRKAHMMRAMAQTMLQRSADAETTLSAPFLKDDPEAALWRAVNDSRQGSFPRALAGLRRGNDIIDAYPDQLQALIRQEFVRSAIAMRDQAIAERELAILGALSPTYLPRDEVEFLRAQLDDISGRPEAALAGYRALFDSGHRPVAARAQLKSVQLADREADASISPEEGLARLETVSFIWRGDEVEIEAIGELGAIYAGQQRWREAFGVARKANGSFPDHPITRKLHDETARQFEELFTSGKADRIPRIDALALFYDFKEFLPIGRRGDEIIRRLADRLVELDLLDQAAELLQHQIDNRLTGAARATVATRLAMIRLMNGKPADALRALSSTRLPELPRDVKRARQLLEAKGLSDLSRTDLALEILGNERGPEVDRLRADILWTARRWREAGEAHERILGEAWRGGEPLDERQRADAMRAAVAYVMATEALSIDRLRAKYAAAMAQTPDARTFAFVTGSARAAAGDIREMARSVANADTLMEFMSEYRKRYPDYASSLRSRQAKPDDKQASAPEGAPKQAESPPAQPAPAAPGRPG